MNPISGYILAGGKSSRMGIDKTLVTLAGQPLVEHAVNKLERVCGEVHILSARPELAAYASLVPDLHPDCGPIGGIEAALAHSPYDWLVLYPADMPFFPTVFLEFWIRSVVHGRARIAMFTVFGKPQPTLLLLHREVAPYISDAIARSEFKLHPILVSAAEDIAARLNLPLADVFRDFPIDERFEFFGWIVPPPGFQQWQILTPAQQEGKAFWFVNVNTPADLALAKSHIDLLDT